MQLWHSAGWVVVKIHNIHEYIILFVFYKYNILTDSNKSFEFNNINWYQDVWLFHLQWY